MKFRLPGNARLLVSGVMVCLFAAATFPAAAQQRTVAITIDDVPNVFLRDGESSGLLRKLDSLQVPVAIFINEANLKLNQASGQNTRLLQSWISRPYVTVGNHSYSHPNYGEIGFDAFAAEVLKGEELSRKMAEKAGKNLQYFRFPFNAMGKDSAQQQQMQAFLARHGYISTPFTVESEDWLYAQLYDKALQEGKTAEAKAIGGRYVDLTLRLFAYFEKIGQTALNRSVKQIYLCHDNRLNTDYLPVLIQRLKEQQYQLVSLDEAMADPVYQLPVHYYGNAGFSWIYRWIPDLAERRSLMRAEPRDQ